jgi:hypothetical protein
MKEAVKALAGKLTVIEAEFGWQARTVTVTRGLT